ncbi:hypothetical protein FACS1894187_20020 [Synergistales bacterium]|nr:hypothetical protein FACS1894187_20020 [Synergistales bacterium]
MKWRVKKTQPKDETGNEKDKSSARRNDKPEALAFRLWAWVLPVFVGIVCGWFCMACIGAWLDRYGAGSRPLAVASASGGEITPSETHDMKTFLAANPFKVTPMPLPLEIASQDTISEDAGPVIVGSLATAVLKGTSPGILAWMEDEGKTRLVLVGGSFDVYTLEEVNYTEAVFVKDDEHIIKELLYGALPVTAPKQPARAAAPVAKAPAPAAGAQVIPADPEKGAPGTVSQELINSLMENPFDEMKRVRIRPSSEGNGIQVQWINRDSILNQLGVQKGDVISSINGIPLRNMIDITNSINSLMNSDRFDVEVKRGGASTSLQYVVK